MASREHDNNCINCLHKERKLSDPHCTACLANIKTMKHFPGWEAKEGTQ